MDKFKLLAIAPVIGVLISYFAFLGYACYLSLTTYELIGGSFTYVGLDNFTFLLTSPDFLSSLIRNILYVGIVITANFFIGLGLAILMNQQFRGRYIIRMMIVVPMLFIPAASALLWRFMYHPDYGLFNIVLDALNLSRNDFLVNPNIALFSVMLTDIWAWTPFVFLILLAGLESLPKDSIEAADVDGASSLQKYTWIVLPMMKRVVIMAVILKAIDTFRAFDYVWIMTGGGPGESSDILSTFVYRSAFKHAEFGVAAAGGVLGLLFILPVILLLLILMRRAQ